MSSSTAPHATASTVVPAVRSAAIGHEPPRKKAKGDVADVATSWALSEAREAVLDMEAKSRLAAVYFTEMETRAAEMLAMFEGYSAELQRIKSFLYMQEAD